ncbi:hypothetical protein OE88DRAFT_1777104 [Heliocybe sulcata]|uniref:C3H1-type domain-containing protein n=1 Tax=Heliocybe sulcata TaxID=5364 RepID=A0A5C3MNG6_9AGAM|nr:hypothetical protein OE88DRAFT_1777104 [Heliocybe sulcata]
MPDMDVSATVATKPNTTKHLPSQAKEGGEMTDMEEGVVLNRDWCEEAGSDPAITDQSAVDWDSTSNSSDVLHEGNRIPCRSYNHDGWPNKRACRCLHAPDGKSIRDKLGRNVCVQHMMVKCQLSAEKCPYSHKLHLLPDKWSAIREDPCQLAKFRFLYRLGVLKQGALDPHLVETKLNRLLSGWFRASMSRLLEGDADEDAQNDAFDILSNALRSMS